MNNKKYYLLCFVILNYANFIGALVLGARNYGYAAQLDSSENLVVAGNTEINDQFQFLLARYVNSDGSLDPSFGTLGIVHDLIGTESVANAIAIQNDTKIIAAGYAMVSGIATCALARYTNTGVLDPSFGIGGIKTISLPGVDGAIINSLALQSDGQIIAAGTAVVSGVSQFLIMRLNSSDGSLDTSFNGTGFILEPIGFLSGAMGVTIDTVGNVLVVGYSLQGYALARYTSSGSLDGTFGTAGIVIFNPGTRSALFAVKLQIDGAIVVTGLVDTQISISRFDSSGSIDPTFGTGGTVLLGVADTESGYDLMIQNDGAIVVAGYSNNQAIVGRVTSTGILDSSFNGTGIVTFSSHLSSQAHAIQLQADQKIVIAGYTCPDVLIARLNSDGSFDATYGNNGIVLDPLGMDPCIKNIYMRTFLRNEQFIKENIEELVLHIVHEKLGIN